MATVISAKDGGGGGGRLREGGGMEGWREGVMKEGRWEERKTEKFKDASPESLGHSPYEKDVEWYTCLI